VSLKRDLPTIERAVLKRRTSARKALFFGSFFFALEKERTFININKKIFKGVKI